MVTLGVHYCELLIKFRLQELKKKFNAFREPKIDPPFIRAWKRAEGTSYRALYLRKFQNSVRYQGEKKDLKVTIDVSCKNLVVAWSSPAHINRPPFIRAFSGTTVGASLKD